MKKLSHTNNDGKAKMVDIGDKKDQKRTAVARGLITMDKETIELIKENDIKKGDVRTVAQIAGIQAAKKTADLIPLCHPLSLNNIEVITNIVKEGIEVTAIVSCNAKTGVEMEALVAVNIALLTIYDMCKAVDKKMKIENVYLVEKIKK